MINPNELRIGNLFWDTHKNIQMVYTVHETVVNESWTGPFPGGDYKLNPGYGEDDMMPIPVTPEWLKSLGFYKIETANCYVYDEPQLDVMFGKDGSVLFIRIKAVKFTPFKKIKYFHHLQNLYLDLTGEEIAIPAPAQKG